MESVTAYIRRLKDWKRTFPFHAIDVVKGYEAEAVDLIAEQQLYEGIDGENKIISPSYKPFTVKIKRFKGQPTDRVTLKDTGDFYNSIKVRYGTGSTNWIMVFWASDSKVEKLKAKYGKDLLGLTPISLEDFIDFLRDDLIVKIQNTL